MKLFVRQESPQQEEIALLLQQSDILAAMLYPGEYRRPLNPETLAAPGINLFVARTDDQTAAGCCAVFDTRDGTAELKRMIVGQGFRQQGVGAALLLAVEAAALTSGIHVIRMEVGIRNTDGQALYRRSGYNERGPFGPYKTSPLSLFFERKLTANTYC